MLNVVAAKHPGTKFIKTIATKCVENFKDHDCPALFFYMNGDLLGNIIPCADILGGKRMTVETIEFVLSTHKMIEMEFEEDPRDKLKLMNAVIVRGKKVDKHRHERDADSDEEGIDDREYISNQYMKYK